MDNGKLQRYEKIIVQQTTRVWEHLVKRVESLPEYIDTHNCSQRELDLIQDVISVEKEWILDDKARLECSLMQFSDTED